MEFESPFSYEPGGRRVENMKMEEDQSIGSNFSEFRKL